MYRLPLEEETWDDGEDNQVQDSVVGRKYRDSTWRSADALRFMLANCTLEIPPSFPHRIVGMPRRDGRKFLECEAFKLYNCFPDNVCLVRDDRGLGRVRVVVVEDFIFKEGSSAAKDAVIKGYGFRKHYNKFHVNPSHTSQRIHYYTVRSDELRVESQEWPVELLFSKCFVLPSEKHVPEHLLNDKSNKPKCRFIFDETRKSGMSWDIFSLIC